MRNTNAQACKSQVVLCFFAAAIPVMAVTDKLTMHTQTPLQCGNEAGLTNPRQTLSPNKRLQPNPVPELFSVTLQAEKEIENLDMDVTAMNPQCTADTEQTRGALEKSPAMSPTEMVCRLLRSPQEKG